MPSGPTIDGTVDMKLEVVTIPVSDVDRAKEFYGRLGWRRDVTPPTVVQYKPPGSARSVQFGRNRTSGAPGSVDWACIPSRSLLRPGEAMQGARKASGLGIGHRPDPSEEP